MNTQLEREEQDLDERYERGEISSEEYNRELKEMYRDYRAAAEERAQDAYQAELERW